MNKPLEDLSDQQILEFIKESLFFLKKEFNLKNFFFELKRNGFSATKHLSFVAPYLKQKKNLKLRDEEAIRKVVQLELADALFRQGSTVDEVSRQTGINSEVLAALLRTYYDELPKSLLMYKMMQHRVFELIQLNKVFLERHVLPELSSHGKLMAQGVLSTMMDMVMANTDDKETFDQLVNSMDKNGLS